MSMNSISETNNGIGYFLSSNIQHIPPVIQLYPHLKGTIITTNVKVRDLLMTKYADLNIPLIYCKSIKEARKTARELQLRVIVYTGYSLLNCGKAVQIFHGGLSDKRYLESARLICYDLVLFPGQKSHDKVELATTLPWIKECQIVGYPKFDSVVKGECTPAELFSNERKTILYAPTWVSQLTRTAIGERSDHGESSLLIWSLAIIEQLADKYNLILKFHSNLHEDKSTIYQEVAELIESRNLQDTVKTVVDDNIVPYMAASDLMISDISSVCYEWLHFNKPILFANPAPGKYTVGKTITDNTYVWQAGDVFDTPEQISVLADRALTTDDKSDVRKKIFEYAVFQADGHAAERQATHIKNAYERVKNRSWPLFYLECFMRLRVKRFLASIFRYTKNIPR
ncbi:MAG: CDP-glycerol glycerophosphotransferase family protein [Oleiphilus sp.]